VPIGEPPTYTVSELERIARAFLAERLGQSIPIPVDIDLLVEKIDGVELDYWPGLRARGLDGMVLRDPSTRQVMIVIDEPLADRQPTRYRMTVGEELAHLLLHRQLIDQVCNADDFRQLQNHYRWHQMERNAKRLAAAMLMPADAVLLFARETYPQLVRVAGFGNAEPVKKYLASQLAKRFEVSVQAMTIRLREWPMRVFERVEAAMRDKLDFLPDV
jgi:Zn-dependent peptidase ImmA (M78 family)